MNNDKGTRGLGPMLREEVERQLIIDAQHYGISSEPIYIDWSKSCPEGHCTFYLDGELENWSDIYIRNEQGKEIACGWIDFIHVREDSPLFVFWIFLRRKDNPDTELVQREGGIPEHVWNTLPSDIKDGLAESDKAWIYDEYVQEKTNHKSN